MNTKKVNEKFKSNVLLVLLKMCTTLLECIILLEGDFKDLSFKKVSVVWRKFLNDFTNLLNKKSSSLSDQKLAAKSLPDSSPKLYKVGSKSSGKSTVPFIRLSGFWLENYGFCIGKCFEVQASKEQLIIKKFSSPGDLNLDLEEGSDG